MPKQTLQDKEVSPEQVRFKYSYASIGSRSKRASSVWFMTKWEKQLLHLVASPRCMCQLLAILAKAQEFFLSFKDLEQAATDRHIMHIHSLSKWQHMARNWTMRLRHSVDNLIGEFDEKPANVC